ncbi:MAG: di-heme-cytochrome C peroxidase [Bermanella sp.]
MNFLISVPQWILRQLNNHKKNVILLLAGFVGLSFLILAVGKTFQSWDDDPSRGAMAITDGEFGENYTTPIYLDQGWSASDSLWFYNITQGSGLLPYDFYLNLEQKNSSELIRATAAIDKYRYLPQKPTFSNPDGLAVGFAKESYQGKDYMGYTCAACHTTQVNYKGQAIRIDGGPAMANMVGYLTAMEDGLKQTISNPEKNQRFVDAVLALNNDYQSPQEVNADLKKWTGSLTLYNAINHSHIKYGYARLDAFGRIYNRVLQYVPNKRQVHDILTQVTSQAGTYIISSDEADLVLQGINETIIGNHQFVQIIERLLSTETGYPALTQKEFLLIRNALFNEPSAPVSYPFLWDIAQSDHVQWNGIADNSGLGPLGRNTGEVIGVFGILDWQAKEPGFSLSSLLTNQDHKKKKVDFKSSIDLTNLERIEHHLASLESPLWPENILGKIDHAKAKQGRKIYGQYCQSCHELIDRNDADRIVISKFSALENIGTDPTMAVHSVTYKGKSGNFKHTYQNTGVGEVILEEEAPVAQILTSVTKGVVATPDADKWLLRRWADWGYTVGASLFTNPIKKSSVKAGNYNPDTTANPYNSLLSYKARSLNGIWATAPYLHNGSVPTIYDLLLPSKKPGDPDSGQYRPASFVVGSREFDPQKVGFISSGYAGSPFTTARAGNLNSGHEYAAGNSPQIDGTVLPGLDEDQRWQLLEFLKTL